MPRVSSQRARLGARLRELRAATYRSGSEMARALGWLQTRVSKLERGEQLPNAEDLDAWVAVTRSVPEVRVELGDLLTSARLGYTAWSDMYRSGDIVGLQADIAVAEAGTALLRGYQPSMIPGIVQTVAYAREMLTIPGGAVLTGATPDRVEALIAERVKRQELLYHPGRAVQIVLGEAALSVHFGSLDTLLGQLDRLVILMGLPSVDLRVLPRAAPSPVMPLSGFWLDDDTVHIETFVGAQELSAPEDVVVYHKAFGLLRVASVAGLDAVALIQHVAAGLCDLLPEPEELT